MTDKSHDKVGHLNTILAIGGGNLNDPIFKSSNARGLPGGGGGGTLKFRVDRRIITIVPFQLFRLPVYIHFWNISCPVFNTIYFSQTSRSPEEKRDANLRTVSCF